MTVINLVKDGVLLSADVHGTGDLVLLLHPGLAPAQLLENAAKPISEHFRVVVPDRRGHGRTPDTPGPYTYEQGAADTIALLESLAQGPADLVGICDGAIVSALVALQRPDLVRSLTLQGKYLNLEGAVPEALAMFRSWTPATVPAIAVELHAALSPDGPAHFPVVLEKVCRLALEGPRLTFDQLHQLTMPVLVLVADDDAVTLEHAVAVFRALPRGQLGVLPGTSHLAFLEKPWLFATVVLDFLRTPDPRTL
ncbi:MAG: alpha/beta hydrolase, partial [Vicinamibacterales bacterium]